MPGSILDAALDDGPIPVKKRTVNAPNPSQMRAQKPEIVTWMGEQWQAFPTWNCDELKDELIAHTGLRRSEALVLR